MRIATIALMAAFGVASAAAVAQTTEPNSTRRPADETMNRGSMDHDSMHKDHDGDKISAADFAKKAGAGGAAEVAMGKLGSQKATDADVKAFAQHMVTDHTKANKELMAAAKAKGVKVPTEPDMMHKAAAKKLEMQAADQDFNHDFMEQMVKDHKATVELFQKAANDSTLDPEFRALAQKTLPTLEEHLADAQKLEARLDKKD
jgi:putative membrane protein